MKSTKISIIATCLITGLAITAAAAPIDALFSLSSNCMACHNRLTTPDGEDVSIGVDWRSSMMANAARDPYWQAAIRRETLAHPTASVEIQHECSACHMPMTRFHAKSMGQKGAVFAHLPIPAAATPASMMAADGVSCTVCHQVTDSGLGTKESFTAGFDIDTSTPAGQRMIYGPFDVDSGRQRLMRSASQFNPAKSEHLSSSELCASCHTLYTHALDDEGQVIGEFPEQMPYLEWQHSAYNGSQSCQNCHMPEVAGEMHVSSVLGLPRTKVSRHVFRGGNFFMPRLLNSLRLDLGVAALPQELESTAIRTRDHLQTVAGVIDLSDAQLNGESITGTIAVGNLAGHKLPSAYPSRRVWIHLEVEDASGETIFESGKLMPDGSIQGNDNDLDATRFEAHYEVLDSPDKVQIYEAMMVDQNDQLTTVLLSAMRYIKDNRLLPEGFDKASANADIAVHGQAERDVNFAASGDRLELKIPVDPAAGPFHLRAKLYYQPVAYRWAQNLADQQALEIDRFVTAYNEHAAVSAVVLAQDSVTID